MYSTRDIARRIECGFDEDIDDNINGLDPDDNRFDADLLFTLYGQQAPRARTASRPAKLPRIKYKNRRK